MKEKECQLAKRYMEYAGWGVVVFTTIAAENSFDVTQGGNNCHR